ncbi:MAG: ribonuclease HII [Alphaproteobacteria bacterium]|nr:ribonuclease HII [Alphaproteobacteria bacterium]
MTYPLIAGLDEAGRGPLAGPVVAAAVILPEGFSALSALDDSKKLTAKRRDELAQIIRAEATVSIALAEPAEIDRLNILHATLAAMGRAAAGLARAPQIILIDGNQVPPGLPCPARAIIGGDGTEPAIAAASIIAKTVRDALMTQAEARFPGYGFAGHKGYPSPVHRAALEALGPCPLHRLGYAPVRAALEKSGFARRMMNPA